MWHLHVTSTGSSLHSTVFRRNPVALRVQRHNKNRNTSHTAVFSGWIYDEKWMGNSISLYVCLGLTCQQICVQFKAFLWGLDVKTMYSLANCKHFSLNTYYRYIFSQLDHGDLIILDVNYKQKESNLFKYSDLELFTFTIETVCTVKKSFIIPNLRKIHF